MALVLNEFVFFGNKKYIIVVRGNKKKIFTWMRIQSIKDQGLHNSAVTMKPVSKVIIWSKWNKCLSSDCPIWLGTANSSQIFDIGVYQIRKWLRLPFDLCSQSRQFNNWPVLCLFFTLLYFILFSFKRMRNDHHSHEAIKKYIIYRRNIKPGCERGARQLEL